jgi:SAM-dependent methyltransferase
MKKLSELVNYKNQLDALSTREAQVFTDLELGKFTHLINDPVLEDNLQVINSAFAEFDNTVTKIKQDLKVQIELAERPWFQESYRLHEQEIHTHSTDHILNFCSQTHQSVKDIIQSRLNLYSSWHHAAMLIRPAKENFINQLVSFDPLYVLDRTHELLAPGVEHFSEAYKNRLRQYTIEDVVSGTYLDKLPNDQFALCVAYMYFDYKPFEVLKQYFTELYQKLKPGGVLAFTFNDCDHDGAVQLVEMRFRCYTPGYLVKELAQSLGFEIIYDWHEPNGAITWLELRKPGVLSSIKGGQTLAKILPKQL